MLKDIPAVEPPPVPDLPPAEIFSQDQLEAHAERIAGTHRLAENPRRGRPLLPRLDESAARLDEAYRFLSAAARTDPQPVGSEDWLRDNYHVVQDQVREIRQDLPRKYYLELPKLADGPLAGLPARLPARARADRAHGRPDRSRDARRFRRRVPARRAALDRRDLGGPDHAAARAGRGAAPPGRRRRRGAPQPRAGAAVARATVGGAPTGPSADIDGSSRTDAQARRPAVGGLRRRAAAVAARPAARRRRRPGRRCSARSRRRTTRPRRCCGSSISARRPTSSRSAT